MHSRLLAQRLEQPERFLRLALIQRHLGLQHQPRHREARRLRVGASEQRLGRLEVAHVDRGARGDDRIQARRSWNLQRLLGVLTRLAVAPFEQRYHRRILLRPRTLDLLLAPPLAHRRRKLHRPGDEP